MRTSEASPLGVEYFTWNTLSSVPQLLMDGSNAYIYGPQGTALGTAPVEQISLSAPNSQSSVTYLVSDPEGVRLTFNSSGTITAGATYSAYGQVIAGGLSSITPFGYAGGYTDPTGLIYLVNRYYDSSTGQFLSVDPLVDLTDQPYQYVGGDPINGSDPLGLALGLDLGVVCIGNCGPKGSGYCPFGHTTNAPNSPCNGSGEVHSVVPQYGYLCGTFVIVQLCIDVTSHGGVIVSPGLGIGFPGFSGGAGWINGGQIESSCQINKYLQGPTLEASGGAGLGGSVVWGNEGHTGSHDWGYQGGWTTPGIEVFQEWGIQIYSGSGWG